MDIIVSSPRLESFLLLCIVVSTVQHILLNCSFLFLQMKTRGPSMKDYEEKTKRIRNDVRSSLLSGFIDITALLTSLTAFGP